MEKKLFILAITLFYVCLLTGCSYREVEDLVSGEIDKAFNNVGDVASGSLTHEELEPIPDKEKQYYGIGESLTPYVHCIDETGVISKGYVIDIGIEGLKYTLENVFVYDSIFDTDVSVDDTTWSNQPDMFVDIPFILLEMSATYSPSTSNVEETMASVTDLEGDWRDDLKTSSYYGIPPQIVYFSDQPDETQDKLDPQHQRFSFFIKSGETYSFQIGIICSREYVKDKNVFLTTAGPDEYIPGFPYRYFDLFQEDRSTPLESLPQKMKLESKG